MATIQATSPQSSLRRLNEPAVSYYTKVIENDSCVLLIVVVMIHQQCVYVKHYRTRQTSINIPYK